MSSIIDVKDLVLVYSDGTKAVDGISFSVREGEFFGFLGPNGAGKSTTIKILRLFSEKHLAPFLSQDTTLSSMQPISARSSALKAKTQPLTAT